MRGARAATAGATPVRTLFLGMSTALSIARLSSGSNAQMKSGAASRRTFCAHARRCCTATLRSSAPAWGPKAACERCAVRARGRVWRSRRAGGRPGIALLGRQKERVARWPALLHLQAPHLLASPPRLDARFRHWARPLPLCLALGPSARRAV